MRIFPVASIAIAACTAFCEAAIAQTTSLETAWPQWRGPYGTGAAAANADPPLKWSDTSGIKWKVRIAGDGTGTPIILGDKVFIQTAINPKGDVPFAGGQTNEGQKGKGPPPGKGPPGEKGKGGPPGGFGGKGGKGGKGGFGGGPPPSDPIQFVLMCIDKNSGKTVWQKVCREEVPHEGFRAGHGSFAAPSALTDGQHVYAFFGSRGLYCLDLAGNVKWEKDFGDQQTRNDFGEGATPAVFGNAIIVPWDHEEEDFIVALDKRTGDELWRQPRDEPTGWATPLIVEHDGKPQIITVGTNRVRSYDLATGKQIWECEGLTTNVIPTPVHANGIVIVMSGYQGNKLLAIRLGRTGDLTGTDAIVWRVDRNTPYVPSPVLSGNRIYFFGDRNHTGILSCHEIQTGAKLFGPSRVEGLPSVYASPVAAAGRVYLVDRGGTTVVIKDADQLEILATNVLNEPIDASPAVVGKEIFLRGRENLYCIAQ